jgi:hypothetical protein
LLAPARCCLKNVGQVGASDDRKKAKTCEGVDLSLEERLVEKAFEYLRIISEMLRNQFDLAQ